MSSKLLLCWTVIGGVSAAGFATRAADAPATNAPAPHLLLTGPLGEPVRVPTNEVPAGLLPPAALGPASQIPAAQRGMKLPEPFSSRVEEGRVGREAFEVFPDYQPRLMPYLAAQDEYGNTAVRPGALLPTTFLDTLPQQAKYRASQFGLRYSLQQTFTFVNMTDVMRGDNVLGFYSFDFAGKWAVFSAPGSGSAGWISAQIEAKTGLNDAGETQSAKSNLGTVTSATDIWSARNGFRIPELAWQQSFRDGEVVVVAGMVSQGNYLDGNSYANSGHSQFLNSALVDTMVMPLPNYNFGVNLEWQPRHDWYAMLGASAGNAHAGQTPWTDFSWNSWSLLGEVGYAPDDFLGLGPGIYRVQPFVAQAGGPTQGGLCFNLQQQLGPHAPFGWFGRVGFGGSDVAAGAKAQVGTGFVMRAPLEEVGLFPSRNRDAAGIGFVWSQPSATALPVAHENEFVFEAGYVLQLTHTMKLQPDFQVVWNPAFNPNADHALVFQLQLDVAW